ncbi:hypothetical protein PAXRUDRAFT_157605, partial [Paxillus rubicundulus Ve08.2h10]
LMLADMTPGAYGISYVIYTWKKTDNLPGGWNSYTSATYKELANAFHAGGFQWLKYSDWICDPTNSADSYWTMLSLMQICPPGKLQSTVKGLKVHYISYWVLDVTHQVQLGGAFSPGLHGLTPAGLVPPNVPAALPFQAELLPDFTWESPKLLNIINWQI